MVERMSGLDEQFIKTDKCPHCGVIPREYYITNPKEAIRFWWFPGKVKIERDLEKSIIFPPDWKGAKIELNIRRVLQVGIRVAECMSCGRAIRRKYLFSKNPRKHETFILDMERVIKRALQNEDYMIWSNYFSRIRL
jgi:hypothetical protein